MDLKVEIWWNLNFSAIGQSSSRMTRTASAGHGHGSHVWQPGIGEVGLAKATRELVFDVFWYLFVGFVHSWARCFWANETNPLMIQISFRAKLCRILMDFISISFILAGPKMLEIDKPQSNLHQKPILPTKTLWLRIYHTCFPPQRGRRENDRKKNTLGDVFIEFLSFAMF